ncbi:hypothetical protein R1flu_014837 [Riccia fluitans]|uniref:DUF676 domain-containing protein n=1 Tax=Riccia fluitans TaxID=41844 RepID=A0ABD1YH84_9MARC
MAGIANATTSNLKLLSENFYEFCKPDNYTVEVIFFHGIQLGQERPENLHLTTWTTRGDASQYWPQTFFKLDEYLVESKVRVRALTVRYDASKMKTGTEGRLDEFLIAENFIPTIINQRFKVGLTEGVPVFLVGHSFGGLIIKKFLNEAATRARRGNSNSKLIGTFLDNLAGVFFYSTPHLALKDEVVQRLFPSDEQYSDLVKLLMELNKDVVRLEEEFQKLVSAKAFGKNWGGIQQLGVFEGAETEVESWKGMILTEGSGRSGTDGGNVIEGVDHFDVCRPTNTGSDSFQRLANFICERYQQIKPSSSES